VFGKEEWDTEGPQLSGRGRRTKRKEKPPGSCEKLKESKGSESHQKKGRKVLPKGAARQREWEGGEINKVRDSYAGGA